jgi:hypothetical protein
MTSKESPSEGRRRPGAPSGRPPCPGASQKPGAGDGPRWTVTAMWTIRRDRHIEITPQAVEAWERLRVERSVTVSSPSGDPVRLALEPDSDSDVTILRATPPVCPLMSSSSVDSPPFWLGVQTRFDSVEDARDTAVTLLAAIQQGAIIPHEGMSAIAYKALFGRHCTAKSIWVRYVRDGAVSSDLPRRESPPAGCFERSHRIPPPVKSCTCGYHGAYSVVELLWWYGSKGAVIAGLLVTVPLGKTLWHPTAWRAERYWVAAAVLPPDVPVPDDWDPEIPVVRSTWVPGKAYDIARELRAERALLQTPDDPQPNQP